MLWVEVVNRALGWEDGEAALPAALVAGDSRILAGPARARLTQDVALLRAAHAALALPRPRTPAEQAALQEWLAAVTLRFAPGAPPGPFGMPALRAHRTGSPLPPALDELLSTALLELLSGEPAAAAVGRCCGVLRRGAAAPPAPDEAAFARAAGLEDLLAGGWRQCPHLVWAPRRGRYCSKACSNAAFALRKASAEPRYFARKQARYRARQTVPPPPRSSAFVAFSD